jgi:biopolymer transport protein ExbD
MKYVLEVCLIAFTVNSLAPSLAAQSQALQPGISVELATTRNASPIPEADSEDAFIVAITANGSLYLGINPITIAELTEKARSTPFRRGQALFIKADARTPYATVLQALEATSSAGMIPQVLLTRQSQPSESSGMLSPEGLEVSVGSGFPPGTVATLVQLLPSAQQRALVKVNNDAISWSALENTLREHFQKGDQKIVSLRADARLSFGEVVQAIDACRAAGAKVFLAHAGR